MRTRFFAAATATALLGLALAASPASAETTAASPGAVVSCLGQGVIFMGETVDFYTPLILAGDAGEAAWLGYGLAGDANYMTYCPNEL